jgi:3-oxoacyl-[acyl-carrier-protein] synthase-1
MRRVVITGIGIVSSIGNSAAEVEASLRAGKSGIVFAPDYAEHGFRCRVHGQPNIVLEDHIDKRDLRFMGDGAAYTFIAMDQAVKDSGLAPADISNDRTGIIVGSGGPSTKSFFKAHNIVRETGSPKRIGPFGVTKGMSSTVSACLATPFKIKGVNYSITSACSTSAHCIGNGTELIQMGKQDIVFAGGGEELDWTLSCLFDAMGAMSSKYNDTPETAPRAPMTPTATALSSRAAAASSCWRSWNTPWPAARRSMAKSPATAPPRTAMTWWPPVGRRRRTGDAAGAVDPAAGPEDRLHQQPRHQRPRSAT